MKLTMTFKLNFEKHTFVAYKTRCLTGYCKKSIYFSYEMTTNIHFMNLPKWCKLGEGNMLIFAFEKISHYFWRRVYIHP